MTIERTDTDTFLAETGGVAFGILMGAIFAGPLGAAAGGAIGELLTPLGERWIAKCRQEFRRRGQILAEAASLTSGLNDEQVVERLLDSEELQPMVARVLDAAARTNSTETLRLLGGVLGEAACDRPRKIDEDLMLVDGITGLEPGHLRVLALFESHADPSNPDVNWGVELITAATADDMSAVASQAAIGGLLSRGLIEARSGFGEGGYKITEFGRALLGALRRSRA
jgi:hypothetical protein